MISIRSDDELNTLIRATIAGGGVVPSKHIPSSNEVRMSEKMKVAIGMGTSMLQPATTGQRVNVFYEEDEEMEPVPKKPKKAAAAASSSSVPFQQNLFAPTIGTPGSFNSMNVMGTPGSMPFQQFGGMPSGVNYGVQSVPDFAEQKKKK